ncbi:MAG TPA: hypothetical protein VKV35_03315 [Streptosporangiaceae bacterium]|jgi:hypothetical protein|nr:hypothetical protein [Streptosporangiaceae bacterium]
MTTPPEVVAMLAGRPAVGAWEPMFPLLTADDRGFPHVCLLSRSELDADGQHVYAVLASRNTIANVRRDGKATLLAVGGETAVSVKLGVTESIDDDGWLGIACRVVSVKRDSLRLPLRPPQYLVSEAVSVTEDWARSERLLAALAGRRSRLPLPQVPEQAAGQGHTRMAG